MLPTQRTKLRRLPTRGSQNWADICRILDAAYLAHVGFVVDGQPFVIPTLYGRRDTTLFVHGSAASRMLRELDKNIAVSISVTLIDGLVLARSAFNHSMNYRSVVAFGSAHRIVDDESKLEALRLISEQVAPGRWDGGREGKQGIRLPNAKEMKATSVLAVEIEEASAKVRAGPPKDDAEDYELDVWAGVVPAALQYGAPVPDPLLKPGATVPAYLDWFNTRPS